MRSDQFLEMIANPGPDCIIWPYSIADGGYAQLVFGGRVRLGHQIACETAHGPRPAGMWAAHGCGVRACINPGHLRWATPSENSADRLLHGTAGWKLTPDSVAEIRALVAQGFPQRQVAKRFGVTQTTVHHVAAGHTWNRPMPVDEVA